jgi:predicted nuclease of predicted toxin-antitoxin system
LKFKIDQNLPGEYAVLLREAGFEADTVDDEGLSGAEDWDIAERTRSDGLALLTLDLGFSDIPSYPPQQYSGIVVLRSRAQDKITLISMSRRLIQVLRENSFRPETNSTMRCRFRYLFTVDSVSGGPQGGKPNSSELRHRQRPKPVDEWKTVCRARDQRTAGHPRLSHNLAHKIEVDRVSRGRQFGPLRFEELQLSADINHKVHLTCAITPEEQTACAAGSAFTAAQLSENKGFPDGARRR